MLRFAADENFNNEVLKGLHRRNAAIDIVRVQDAALSGADDVVILEWAASQHRVLLTHDVSTMTAHAYERVVLKKTMPGVIEIGRGVPLGRAIDEILLLAECSFDGEWEGQVLYLPLR